MADKVTNGGGIKNVLGVIGMIIGIVGGSFGLAEVIGRDRDIASLKNAQVAQGLVNIDREGRLSKLEARWESIQTALARIEDKVDARAAAK